MREIKFKVYNKEQKRFHELISNSKNWNHLIQFGDKDKFWIYDGEGKLVATDENSLLIQFTNLKDKNNNEIYEGDIIKVTKTDRKFTGVVKYEIQAAQYWIKWEEKSDGLFEKPKLINRYWPLIADYGDEDYLITCAEIIGNIYENHELLEK